jgi:copper chaperone CopZ
MFDGCTEDPRTTEDEMMHSARCSKVFSWRQRRLLILAAVAVSLASPIWLFGPDSAATAAENKQGMKTAVIPVEGMVCVACAAMVKKALKSLTGVSNVEVSMEKRTALVTFEAGKVSLDRIVAAIDNAGYKAGTPKEVE